MVREFKLINEKGKEYSFMDIENHCLLTDPDGLGYSFSSSFEKVGDSFFSYLRSQEQQNISGTCNFKKYDNYAELVNFIESSIELKLSYTIPFKDKPKIEYFKDIKLYSLGKTEIQQNGILSCPISFEMLSLWYEKKEYRYDITATEDEVRWDFEFGLSRWQNYSQRKIEFENTGHTEAPIYLEIDGFVENPEILVQDTNSNVLFDLVIPIIIKEYETFIYSSLDGAIQIAKRNIDGTIETLFKQDCIDITKDNIFKLPQGISKITIKAENEISSANLTIFPYYRSV